MGRKTGKGRRRRNDGNADISTRVTTSGRAHLPTSDGQNVISVHDHEIRPVEDYSGEMEEIYIHVDTTEHGSNGYPFGEAE